MKLLVLGGTGFLGRHIVEVALARGHEITLFNRGQHNPELFPGVEKLRGDRSGDLTALRDRHAGGWDAAIDTSGFVPRVVRASAGALADSVNHYTFISSISVYADFQFEYDTSRRLTMEKVQGVGCSMCSAGVGEYHYTRAGEVLRCPWHGWEYDLRTGQSWFDPSHVIVRRYEVSVEHGAQLLTEVETPPGMEGLRPGPYVAETFPVSIEQRYILIEMG